MKKYKLVKSNSNNTKKVEEPSLKAYCEKYDCTGLINFSK